MQVSLLLCQGGTCFGEKKTKNVRSPEKTQAKTASLFTSYRLQSDSDNLPICMYVGCSEDVIVVSCGDESGMKCADSRREENANGVWSTYSESD